jgi:hypothetical protein
MLGGVWLGEILKNRERAEKLLGAEKHIELMAVVALGHPSKDDLRSNGGDRSNRRDRLEEKIFLRK